MKTKTLVCLSAFAVILGCSGPNTTLMTSWKDPDTKQLNLGKISIVAATENGEIRREAEDQLAQLIPIAKPSYVLISAAQLKDPATAKTILKTADYDGVIVMRLLSMKEEVTYVPASPSTDVTWEAYDWEHMGIPLKQKTAILETRLFSLTENKLLWAGKSKTLEPGSLRKSLPGVVSAIREQLQKEGLLPVR